LSALGQIGPDSDAQKVRLVPSPDISVAGAVPNFEQPAAWAVAPCDEKSSHPPETK
jgi:hypothetical protein